MHKDLQCRTLADSMRTNEIILGKNKNITNYFRITLFSELNLGTQVM